MDDIRPTKFPELGYCNVARSCWRIIDLSDGKPAAVGSPYRTKAALLDDIDRVAWDRGISNDTFYTLGSCAPSDESLPPGVAWDYVELPQDAPELWARMPNKPVSAWRNGVIRFGRELTQYEIKRYDLCALRLMGSSR